MSAGAVAMLIALAAAGYFGVGTGFLPAADEGGFVIDYRTPSGSALGDTDARVRHVEAILEATPEIATFSRRTGSSGSSFRK